MAKGKKKTKSFAQKRNKKKTKEDLEKENDKARSALNDLTTNLARSVLGLRNDIQNLDNEKRALLELMRCKEVDRAPKEGDKVMIDFVGVLPEEDEKLIQGGYGLGYILEIGSNNFIDGFEDQLVGRQKGDVIKVDVKFPEEYGGNKELEGKEASFYTQILRVFEPLDGETKIPDLYSKLSKKAEKASADLKEVSEDESEEKES